MPIHKFHSLAEASGFQKFEPGKEEFHRSLCSVFYLAARFAPSSKLAPGVTKFRSIEEAQAQRLACMRRAIRSDYTLS
jgi:hypothetical protein